MKIKPLKSRDAARIGMSFCVTGYQDYLGARLLLNHALLLQGATLASTAVEKYLKAFLAGRGQQAFGHLSDWSSAGIDRIAKELSLNPDFMALLQQVYRIRYLDSLKAPVSFSIERSKFLAELDKTIALLNSAISLRRGEDHVNPYESDTASERSELVDNNVAISNASKTEHLNKPDLAEAFYIDASLEIISCVVTGWIPIDERCFTTPGIVRVGNEYRCQLVAAAA